MASKPSAAKIGDRGVRAREGGVHARSGEKRSGGGGSGASEEPVRKQVVLRKLASA